MPCTVVVGAPWGDEGQGKIVAALHAAARAGQRVLPEGAQGALLDRERGTYPHVTSSPASAAAARARQYPERIEREAQVSGQGVSPT